jgi:hypothetical protein
MADKKISALTDVSTPLAGTEVVPVVQSGSTKKVSVANLTAGRVVGASGLTVDGNAAVQIAIGLNTAGNSTASLIMGKVAASGGTIVNTIRLATYGTQYGSAIKATSDLGATTASTLSLQTTPGGGGVPTDRVSVDDTGNTTINTGNLVIGTAGKGIDFTQDPNPAGMTSELLDDYEEGTWTPGISGDGGSAGAAAFTSAGFYTKVGRMVTLHGYVAFTDLGSWTGRVAVTGTPYSANVNAAYGAAQVVRATIANALGVNSSTGAVSFTAVHFPWNSSVGGGGDHVRFTDLAADSFLAFTITYITA